MDKRTVAVGGVTALALGVIGCSGSHHTSVSGNRDDVKHKSAVRQIASRPTYRTDCASARSAAYIVKKPAPSRPKAPAPKAFKPNKAPKVVPPVPKTSRCHKVKTGTESYWREISADKWCVELDNVNGNKSADDRWFTVTETTYNTWATRHEGDRVTKMQYLRTGC